VLLDVMEGEEQRDSHSAIRAFGIWLSAVGKMM